MRRGSDGNERSTFLLKDSAFELSLERWLARRLLLGFTVLTRILHDTCRPRIAHVGTTNLLSSEGLQASRCSQPAAIFNCTLELRVCYSEMGFQASRILRV
jgi:hypothetical protein